MPLENVTRANRVISLGDPRAVSPGLLAGALSLGPILFRKEKTAMEVTIYKLFRAVAGLESGRNCSKCLEPIHPRDAFGLSESVCHPCRVVPS